MIGGAWWLLRESKRRASAESGIEEIWLPCSLCDNNYGPCEHVYGTFERERAERAVDRSWENNHGDKTCK